MSQIATQPHRTTFILHECNGRSNVRIVLKEVMSNNKGNGGSNESSNEMVMKGEERKQAISKKNKEVAGLNEIKCKNLKILPDLLSPPQTP